MLNSGKKFALSATKKKYSNSCVIRKKNSERNKKRNPPFKLNVRSLKNNKHHDNCFVQTDVFKKKN